jgi:hypothetical protein
MKTLWQDTRSRPRMPVRNPCLTVVVTFTLLLSAVDDSEPSAATGERSRPFCMGFAAFSMSRATPVRPTLCGASTLNGRCVRANDDSPVWERSSE